MLSRPAPTIQAKLAINKPGDSFEQEADRVADQVMRMPEPGLQRACACGSSGGECAACKKRDEAGLQRAAHGSSAPFHAPAIVHEVLRSPGQSIDPATRAFMEPRFGYDFSGVQVHTDARAAESAQAANALAYTVGPSIVFGSGQYHPTKTSGLRLVAHELAHVVWGEPLRWHSFFGHSFRFRKSVLASPSRRKGLGKGTAFESPSPAVL